jgi:hypothetical protein
MEHQEPQTERPRLQIGPPCVSDPRAARVEEQPEDDSEGMCADVASGSRTKRFVLIGLGWAFVGLGIAGLVLPILQGFLFLAIGLLILSRQSVWVCTRIEKLRQRHPKLDHGLRRADEKTHAWWEAIKRRFR